MIIERKAFSENVAILLGNGLNNYSKLPISWKELLINLSDKNKSEKILDTKEITYPEYFDTLCFEKGEYENRYKSLKPKIVSNIKNWTGITCHRKLSEFGIKNDIPILTTNYDTTLLSNDLIEDNKKITKRRKSEKFAPIKPDGRIFTDFYPWHSYYSNKKITEAKKEFAIWHIHGFWYYQRSLAIGSTDYAAYIHRLKDFISNKKYGLYNCDYDSWIGRNSWVDIFFHNDLIILGLSLEVQETSLRWLLMEREKYFRNNELNRKKTIFITNKKFDSFGIGKKYLFDKIGIFHQEYDLPQDIYEEWEFV